MVNLRSTPRSKHLGRGSCTILYLHESLLLCFKFLSSYVALEASSILCLLHPLLILEPNSHLFSWRHHVSIIECSTVGRISLLVFLFVQRFQYRCILCFSRLNEVEQILGRVVLMVTHALIGYHRFIRSTPAVWIESLWSCSLTDSSQRLLH